MIVTKRNHGYSSSRKYIHGRGFTDSLVSSLRSIGSYVSQNKDLIAKPILGAVGNLSALGLTEGVKALASRAINKKNQTSISEDYAQLNPKAKEIIKSITSSKTPLTNIIGSGTKKF